MLVIDITSVKEELRGEFVRAPSPGSFDFTEHLCVMSITNMRIALIIQVYSRVSVVSNLRVLRLGFV